MATRDPPRKRTQRRPTCVHGQRHPLRMKKTRRRYSHVWPASERPGRDVCWVPGARIDELRGLGRAMFAAVLLIVGGVLNVIYGIAAIGNSSLFVHNTHYVFSNLKTWGWITLILGILEIGASLSLVGGGAYGAMVGNRGRLTRRDRRIAGDPRVPILVTRGLRIEPLDHPRPGDLRRAGWRGGKYSGRHRASRIMSRSPRACWRHRGTRLVNNADSDYPTG
jgi:hypothetical protein